MTAAPPPAPPPAPAPAPGAPPDAAPRGAAEPPEAGAPPDPLRVGTRGSELALWQAHRVAALWRARTGREVELVVVRTSGDADQLSPLRALGGAGAFTKELEDRLLAGTIDVAVHSLKDLPTRLDPRLRLAAIPERAEVEDLLVARPEACDPAREGEPLPLRAGARVGSSSLRRRALLASARPDLALGEIRGNVPTRVRKVREGVVDATVLARAGLARLGLPLDDLVVRALDPAVFVPAPGQGALAIEARASDGALLAALARHLHDERAARAVDAERGLLALLEGGCTLPLGAHAVVEAGGAVALRAALGDPEGSGADGACGAEGAHGADRGGLERAFVRAATPEAAARLAARVLGGPRGPAVARPRPDLGPLRGRKVAITRAPARGEALAARLARCGAEAVLAPAIETVGLIEPPALRGALDALPAGAWVVVTSAAAASALAAACATADAPSLAPSQTPALAPPLAPPQAPSDPQVNAPSLAHARAAPAPLARLRVAAVGPATALALGGAGIAVDLLGDAGGAGLADLVVAADAALGRAAGVAFLPQAREARPEVALRLAAAGYEVRALAVYETRALPGARYPEGVPLALVASPSAARALGPPPPAVSVVAIGETTAAALRALGCEPAATASSPDLEGQVAALAEAAAGAVPAPCAPSVERGIDGPAAEDAGPVVG